MTSQTGCRIRLDTMATSDITPSVLGLVSTGIKARSKDSETLKPVGHVEIDSIIRKRSIKGSYKKYLFI